MAWCEALFSVVEYVMLDAIFGVASSDFSNCLFVAQIRIGGGFSIR